MKELRPGVTQIESILGQDVCRAICNNPQIAQAVSTLVTNIMTEAQGTPYPSGNSFPERVSAGNASPTEGFIRIISDDLCKIWNRIPLDATSRRSFLLAIGLNIREDKWASILQISGHDTFFSRLLEEAPSFSPGQLKNFLVELKKRSFNHTDKLLLGQYADTIPSHQK